jgi:dUTP pyrophosphatase
MDLKAFLSEPVTIPAGKRFLVPTGIYIELPDGYEAQIRARSGLASKRGITMANGVGTIDSDYRGEIKVALVNLGDEDFVIENGDRIAQMVIARYEKVVWDMADELTDTARGGGGFGHTGV